MALWPETKYVKVGDSLVAYQIIGDGPIDLVHVAGQAGNVEMQWEFPPLANMLERISKFCRLITFDRRGTGISDPLRIEALPSWENWTDDLTAVLDAAGSERTAILAEYDAGLWGMLFAATHPERTSALVLWDSWARQLRADGYDIGITREASDFGIQVVEQMWGTIEFSRLAVPQFNENETALRQFARWLRSCCSPATMASQQRYLRDVDVREILPSIQAPTLVLHRDNGYLDVEYSRYVAKHIQGARFVELAGTGLGLWWGNEEALNLIEGFVTGVTPAQSTDRVLATVVFTDIVESTEVAVAVGDRRWREKLNAHDKASKSALDRYGGRLVRMTGDGLLATFEAPGRAIRCALEMSKDLRQAGVAIRAGLHTGEVELRDEGDVGGIAVHIGARVMAEAGPGEVVCSRTVKDLVAGSEFDFEDRGSRALKGVPDEWQLFAVKGA